MYLDKDVAVSAHTTKCVSVRSVDVSRRALQAFEDLDDGHHLNGSKAV